MAKKKSESTLSLGFERLEKWTWIRFFSAIAPIKIMMNLARKGGAEF